MSGAPDPRPPFRLEPVVLEGRHVRLRPLRVADAVELLEVGDDPRVWAHLGRGPLADEDGARAYVEDTLADRDRHGELPFAIVPASTGRAHGVTRLFDVHAAARGVEIGHTWIGRPHWRTPVNTEAKLLLLAHAFEALGAERVQLKTDIRNERSQAAIARLGAVREGVLRSHMRRPDGTMRDTVLYSVVAAEWPGVKDRLRGYLAPREGPHQPTG